MNRVRVSPSLLSADFADLKGAIESVEAVGVDLLHIDVMDGHFVPNITFGPIMVDAIRRLARSQLDVHLMIDDPAFYLERFVKAGANCVSFHVEAMSDARPLLDKARALGVMGGIAINPDTSLEAAGDIFEVADIIVMMTVNPGFGGQGFIREVIPKIRALYELRQSSGYGFEIEVDGGVSAETAAIVAWAGADILVAGNAIYKSGDPPGAVKAIAEKAREGLARRADAGAFSL